MSDTTTRDPEAMKRRIEALLRQAEDKSVTAEEAEAFSAKAFELAEKYRIDLASLRGTAEAQIGRTKYVLAGSKYLRASLALFTAVSHHYGVLVLVSATGNSKYPTLVGDKDDVEMVVRMFESLRLQRDTACLAEPVPEYGSTTTFRNSFAYGYAIRIERRLRDIRKAQREAVQDAQMAATASGTTDATASTALAVMDRLDAVKKYVEESVGKPLSNVGHNRPTISVTGATAGDLAARQADLGGHRIGSAGGGGPRALGGGQ